MLSIWEPNKAFFEKFLEDDFLRGSSRVAAPKSDVLETPEAFLVHIDLPGMKKEDIQIHIEDGYLTISGERTYNAKNENQKALGIERWFGKFQRSYRLATSVKTDQVKAGLENGVLEVFIPKADEGRKKVISIH